LLRRWGCGVGGVRGRGRWGTVGVVLRLGEVRGRLGCGRDDGTVAVGRLGGGGWGLRGWEGVGGGGGVGCGFTRAVGGAGG